MKKANINAAIALLSNNMGYGILPLNNETLKHLNLKDQEPKIADKNEPSTYIPESIHDAKFESIDAKLVK